MVAIAVRSQDKTAATRIGVSVEYYLDMKTEGKAWCSICRSFKPAEDVPARECKACTVARLKIRREKRAQKRRDCE